MNILGSISVSVAENFFKHDKESSTNVWVMYIDSSVVTGTMSVPYQAMLLYSDHLGFL